MSPRDGAVVAKRTGKNNPKKRGNNATFFSQELFRAPTHSASLSIDKEDWRAKTVIRLLYIEPTTTTTTAATTESFSTIAVYAFPLETRNKVEKTYSHITAYNIVKI